jgi:hypothetical protein
MANDFMKNANKVSLNGEVVSFSNTFPIVDVKEDVVETPIVEEPKKTRKAKKEEKVKETVVETNDIEETEDEKITESTEETTEGIVDEE